jgi:hypothetical protein
LVEALDPGGQHKLPHCIDVNVPDAGRNVKRCGLFFVGARQVRPFRSASQPQLTDPTPNIVLLVAFQKLSQNLLEIRFYKSSVALAVPSNFAI